MSANELMVEVLSPSKVLFSKAAKHVNAPGEMGYLGILPGHAPLIALLKTGTLKVEGNSGETLATFNIDGGYIDVADNHVTLLVDGVR